MADGSRITFNTAEDIATAAKTRLLEESHFLDIKRELSPPGSGNNKEIARDLASFGRDGGQIIYGVGETPNGGVKLTPFNLSGCAERIEQIALSRVDPRLHVVCHEIPSDDQGNGYLVVEIPPSPESPHMVDGAYYGRSDKTKYRLSDAEVERLIRSRQRTDDRTVELLQREMSFARFPDNDSRLGHLFIVAEPLTGDNEMLLRHFDDGRWQEEMFDLLRAARGEMIPIREDEYSPTLSKQYFHHPARRSDGWALVAHVRDDRTIDRQNESNAQELEIREGGGIRLFVGRATDMIDEQRYAFDTMFVGMTRSLIGLILATGQRASYYGTWTLGIGVTGLKGVRSMARSSSLASSPTYVDDEYRQFTRATEVELRDAPGNVMDRLLGRLLRSLGSRRNPRHEVMFGESTQSN